MTVVEEDVSYVIELGGVEEDRVQFAAEALECLAEHGVINPPDEQSLVEWEVDNEQTFLTGASVEITIRKVFDEDADEDA